MAKANARFEKLHFTAHTLKDCKKRKLSATIIQNLKHRYSISIIMAGVLAFLFSSGGWWVITNKPSLVEQVGEHADIIYYLMIFGTLGFVVLFVYGLIKDLINYMNVDNESVITVDAELNDIHYKITANRTNQSYLRVKGYNVAPISGFTSQNEVFDDGTTYRFYFAKSSKVFLAVEEKKAHKK